MGHGGRGTPLPREWPAASCIGSPERLGNPFPIVRAAIVPPLVFAYELDRGSAGARRR